MSIGRPLYLASIMQILVLRLPLSRKPSSIGLFGVTWMVAVLSVVTVIASPAQTFTSLASFNGSNGAFPSGILQGADGKLWVTTMQGGSSNCGVLDKVTLAGYLTKASNFKCAEGEPEGLIPAADGNYYGITFFGGPSNGGTVFRLTPTRVLTVLYSFTAGGSTGSGPVGLIQGADGNFYGATYSGGSQFDYGTVFKMTADGTLTTLYQFDFTHGAQPYAGLVQGTDGNFYGTTYSGGDYGGGTAYKITPQGDLTLLYSFGWPAGAPDSPVTSLIQGTDGDFYGSTPDGGNDNDGTIFKISPTGILTVLHKFAETDGRCPGDLVQATDGNFYGTTAYGGAYYSNGTVFSMTPAGVVTTLHSFDITDGRNPGQLIQDTNGTFYGITGGGGDLMCDPSYGCGTVFSLATGLRPFVETVPTSGSIGTPVTILGTHLKSTISVSFNGTLAAFTIVSGSKITTTVPIGATSGKVTVRTLRVTLSTKVPFTVTN